MPQREVPSTTVDSGRCRQERILLTDLLPRVRPPALTGARGDDGTQTHGQMICDRSATRRCGRQLGKWVTPLACTTEQRARHTIIVIVAPAKDKNGHDRGGRFAASVERPRWWRTRPRHYWMPPVCRSARVPIPPPYIARQNVMLAARQAADLLRHLIRLHLIRLRS
jgi:hypothetical protein